MTKNIKIQVENENCIPTKAHETDGGYDLRANGNYLINPGQTLIVDSGVKMELPHEDDFIWIADVRPRSGLSLKSGLRITNSPGLIDENYRANIGIIIQNIGNEAYRVTSGDKVAQLVISRVPLTKLEVVEHIDENTDRGLNGFGSTGK